MRLTVFIECSVPSPSWTSPDIRLYEELFSYTNIQQYLLANFQFEIKYSGGDAADQRHLNHTAAYTFPIQSTSELILARINVQTCWLNCQRPYPRNESLRTHILKLANQRPCMFDTSQTWLDVWLNWFNRYSKCLIVPNLFTSVHLVSQWVSFNPDCVSPKHDARPRLNDKFTTSNGTILKSSLLEVRLTEWN